jgi:hypothetical protein
MFIFTYLPQGKSTCPLFGNIDFRSSVCTILCKWAFGCIHNRSLNSQRKLSTLITVLSKNFLIADALIDTFDGVLVSRNETGIVSEGRQLKSGSDPINKVSLHVGHFIMDNY